MVYTPFGWYYNGKGKYLCSTVASSSVTVTVKMNISQWASAKNQFGRGSHWGGTTSAKVRVCVGHEYFDFGIRDDGLLIKPSGWSTLLMYESSKTFYLSAPAAPFSITTTDVSGNYPNFFIGPPQIANYTWTAGWNVVKSGYSPTTGPGITIKAYEIDPPDQDYQNPAGWAPYYKWYEEADGDGYIAGDTDQIDVEKRIDKQETSIFKTRLTVSQGTHFIKPYGVFRKGNAPYWQGYPDPMTDIGVDGATADSGKTTEVVIDLTPQIWVDGNIPVINPRPTGGNPDRTNGGGTGKRGRTKKKPKPPKDPSDDNQWTPINNNFYDNGETPVLPDEWVGISVSPDPLVHDNTDVGTIKNKSFTVQNIGTASVNIDSIVNDNTSNPFSFAMESPITIPFTINAGESLFGKSYFVPTSAIAYSGSVHLKKSGTIIRTFTISGTGTTSGNPGETVIKKIALVGDTTSNGDTNFLEQTIGTTTLGIIKAVNVGNTPLILNTLTVGGSGAYSTPGIVSGITLPIGAEKELQVLFSPVAAENYLGTLTLNSDATSSDQTGFDPATGNIIANLTGKGVPEEVITRIMEFNVQNGGTFQDVLAGGSATGEITATISSKGTGSIRISQFQIQSPFTLDLAPFGQYTIGSFQFYLLNQPLIIEPEGVSAPFIIKFNPPTATNYVDDVAIVSNKTIGPDSFEVRGLGTFTEPEEPSGPIEPEEPGGEPPPDQEFDPGTEPSTALDGIGSACIPKECEVIYVYEYSSNGKVVK